VHFNAVPDPIIACGYTMGTFIFETESNTSVPFFKRKGIRLVGVLGLGWTKLKADVRERRM